MEDEESFIKPLENPLPVKGNITLGIVNFEKISAVQKEVNQRALRTSIFPLGISVYLNDVKVTDIRI